MNRTIKFGTDGWRAIIAQEFTVESVARLSYGLARWVKEQDTPNRVVIGYDCRFAGKLFCQACATVLLSEGIEVKFADRIVTTPMLAMAARDLQCTAGVMMTASHNAADYQGFKLKSHLGGPMSGAPLTQIESYIPDQLDGAWKIAKIHRDARYNLVDIETAYIKAIEAAFDMNSIRSKSTGIAYDAMYGTGQFVMKQILPEATHFRCELDPSFKGLSPEPIERNLAAFQELMRSNDDLDFGLVNDGDADRIGLVGGDGRFIDSHHIILLLIHYLVHYKGVKGKVVTAFSTVDAVRRLCAHYGLPLEIVKIGFKYASEVIIREPIMLAGEESGGIAVAGHIPERDGIWMGLMLMEAMSASGKGLYELIDEVYAITGAFFYMRNDLKLDVLKKENVVDRCTSGGFDAFGKYDVQELQTLDGFKYILSDTSWVMIRPSGTEPVLRVYVDAPNRDEAEQIMRATLAAIDDVV